jgi:hypothetical protein
MAVNIYLTNSSYRERQHEYYISNIFHNENTIFSSIYSLQLASLIKNKIFYYSIVQKYNTVLKLKYYLWE